jgi:hypothetical protein
LILASGRAVFLTRVWFRARAYAIDERSLARIGLAETATSRVVTLVEKLGTGALREVNVVLFPAVADEVLRSLLEGAWRAGLVRVRSDSESARRGLPGFADRGRSTRLPAEDAGSPRCRRDTIAPAIGLGAHRRRVRADRIGYLFAVRCRFVLGWLISGYLSLCVVASMGIGWPATVLYATLLNVLALRDLTRNAIKARVDGYVDRRAWLPAVSGRVWVPSSQLVHASDQHREGDRRSPTARGAPSPSARERAESALPAAPRARDPQGLHCARRHGLPSRRHATTAERTRCDAVSEERSTARAARPRRSRDAGGGRPGPAPPASVTLRTPSTRA